MPENKTARPASKSAMYQSLAESTGLSRKQIAAVFDELTKLIRRDVGKRGPGVVALPGLLKIKRVVRKARPARQGRNPATGETIEIAASKKLAFTPAKQVKDAMNPAATGKVPGVSAAQTVADTASSAASDPAAAAKGSVVGAVTAKVPGASAAQSAAGTASAVKDDPVGTARESAVGAATAAVPGAAAAQHTAAAAKTTAQSVKDVSDDTKDLAEKAGEAAKPKSDDPKQA